MPIGPETLLTVGGQLLGGLLGRRKEKPISAGDNAFSHVGGIMRASAKYGINQLTLLGAVPAMGGTPGFTDNSSFGNAVANSAMLLGDSILAKQDTAAKLNDYQTQNQRLTARLNAMTIRAPVPGLYGTARQPADPEVYGGTDGSLAGASVSGGGAAGGPVPALGSVTPYPADTRRQQDVVKTTNDGGVGIIDNPNLNRAFPVPMVNGEVLDLGQSIVVGGSLLYDRALQRRERMERSRRTMTVGKPLEIPFGIGPSRVGELLPGRRTKGKPKSSIRYDSRWLLP